MNSSDADEKTACPTRRPRLPALPTAPAPAPDLSPLSIPGLRSPHLSRAAGRSSHSHTRAHGTRDAHAPLSSSPGRWRGAVLAFHHLGSWCSRDVGRNLTEKKAGDGIESPGLCDGWRRGTRQERGDSSFLGNAFFLLVMVTAFDRASPTHPPIPFAAAKFKSHCSTLIATAKEQVEAQAGHVK